MDFCPYYCGVSCVDGSCPLADLDYFLSREEACPNCFLYCGCDDCAFAGSDCPNLLLGQEGPERA